MLVKIVILVLSLSFVLAYDKDSVNRIFENLNKQKFNKIEVSNLANPFQKIDLNVTKIMPNSSSKAKIENINKEENPLPKLQAIFNSRVKLENKWYKLGDKIFGYKIVEIKLYSIVLKNEKEEKVLSLVKNNEAVRILNEIH